MQNIAAAVLDTGFITTEEGEELVEQIVQVNDKVAGLDRSVVDLRNAFEAFVRANRIGEVLDEIRDVQDEIAETALHVETSGSTSYTRRRLDELSNRLMRLYERRDCLQNDNVSNKALCEIG